LVKELQSLGLDVKVISEEAGEMEIKDSSDDIDAIELEVNIEGQERDEEDGGTDARDIIMPTRRDLVIEGDDDDPSEEELEKIALLEGDFDDDEDEDFTKDEEEDDDDE
jgi:DNA-directed RNA polymerase subunit beta